MTIKRRLLFTAKNYYLFLIAVSLIISGYLLMTGDGNNRGDEFNSEIYSFRRITLAPVVLLAGYALIIRAIMWSPKTSNRNEKSLNGKI